MSTSPDQDVRYEPDEQPPLPLTIGFGLQYAVLTVAGVVLSPAILVSTVGGSEAYLAWVVFGALLVSGVTTVIQAARVGRIGSGYLLLMGSSSAYLAICVAALERGGGGLLGSLIIVSSLFQFMLAAKLSLFRRIFTPTVAGTVLMLIPVTLSAIIVRKLTEVPAEAAPEAARSEATMPPRRNRPAAARAGRSGGQGDLQTFRGTPESVKAYEGELRTGYPGCRCPGDSPMAAGDGEPRSEWPDQRSPDEPAAGVLRTDPRVRNAGAAGRAADGDGARSRPGPGPGPRSGYPLLDRR